MSAVLENIVALSSYGLQDHQLYLDELVNEYTIEGVLITIPHEDFVANLKGQILCMTRTLEDLSDNFAEMTKIAETLIEELIESDTVE